MSAENQITSPPQCEIPKFDSIGLHGKRPEGRVDVVTYGNITIKENGEIVPNIESKPHGFLAKFKKTKGFSISLKDSKDGGVEIIACEGAKGDFFESVCIINQEDKIERMNGNDSKPILKLKGVELAVFSGNNEKIVFAPLNRLLVQQVRQLICGELSAKIR